MPLSQAKKGIDVEVMVIETNSQIETEWLQYSESRDMKKALKSRSSLEHFLVIAYPIVKVGGN